MKNEKRKEYNVKQLLIEVPSELHAQIKMAAARRNIPMRTFIIRHLVRALKNEI